MAALNTKSAFPSPDELNNWLGGGLTMDALNQWRAPERAAMGQQWQQQQQNWMGITPPGTTAPIAPPTNPQQSQVPFHYVLPQAAIVTPPANAAPETSAATASSPSSGNASSLTDLLKMILGQTDAGSSGVPTAEQFSLSNNWASMFG